MNDTSKSQSTDKRASSAMPVWMPAQFKDEDELPQVVRRRRERKRARLKDDYAGRDFTLGEVIANSVSQGVAAALSIAVLVILVVRAVGHGETIFIVAALAFAIPMILAFTMSTLYHALQAESAKRVFKVLDNSSTYLLVAGAFSPYCLITLGTEGGVMLFAAEWALAAVGVVIEAVWATRPRWIHGVLYGIMCVAFLTFTPTLFAALPAPAFWLLFAAFVVFAISLVFRLLSDVPYLRMVFHIIATAGFVCLFLSVVLFVI